MIVAIDGPAGAGKSTIAQDVARRLDFQLVDTGAIYRTVAYHARQRDVPLDDGEAVAALASDLDFSFSMEDGENVLRCDGEVMGDEIRTQANSAAASIVSTHSEVRDALLEVQRNVGRSRDSVLEGRDIGTVVFPDAEVKIFLTASAQVRARRRTDQLEERGDSADYDAILREIQERDARDSERETAPLKKADDAVEIDSTAHTIDEVVERILAVVEAARS